MTHSTANCDCVAHQRERLIRACIRRIQRHGPSAVISCQYVLERMQKPKP